MAARKSVDSETTVVLLAQIRELLFALLLALEWEEGISQETHFQRVGEMMATARKAYSAADPA